MHKQAFWRAMHSLAHPVTVGAVAALLLNDHLLRHRWPSWWTGKLGDFAWLVYLKRILPRVPRHMKPEPTTNDPQPTTSES